MNTVMNAKDESNTKDEYGENQARTELSVCRLGLIEYNKADSLQRAVQQQRIDEKTPDTLMLLEHPSVITLGTRGTMNDILINSDLLKEKKVQVVKTDRGGQNTIHTPGQLVGYVLVHLYRKQRALRQFIYDLEQSLIDTLKAFSINAFHNDEHTGVWAEQGKIAAIGISINQGVTRHGFALNVNTALDIFDIIVPCGISNGSLSSMEKELGHTVPMRDVEDMFITIFSKQKGYEKTIETDSRI